MAHLWCSLKLTWWILRRHWAPHTSWKVREEQKGKRGIHICCSESFFFFWEREKGLIHWHGCVRLKCYWISVLCGMARDQAKWFCLVVIVTACCVRSFFVFPWLSYSLCHSLMLQPYKISLCVTLYSINSPCISDPHMCDPDTYRRPTSIFQHNVLVNYFFSNDIFISWNS